MAVKTKTDTGLEEVEAIKIGGQADLVTKERNQGTAI